MKIGVVLCLAMALAPWAAECKFADRKIFVSKFAGAKKTLPEIEKVRNEIQSNAIQKLRALPEKVRQDLTHHAETAMKKHYPVKTATDYLEYSRDGNRNHYERKLGDHRTLVNHLVIGNLLDQMHNASSLKYMDQIVDGIWMIMEESTWSLPAHLYLQKTSDHLPTPGHNAIDLGAGEVAKFLGWVKLLMHDKLDHVSPVINKRIDFELRRRIFQGFLDTDDFFWEGFHGAHVVNNWNIWVNGNILKAAVFTLNDAELFNKVLNKTLYSADYFLDGYGDDGGCDEGPAYWRQAGGRLIEYLESIDQLFAGAKAYFDDIKLIKLIGEYSYKMRIDKNWFVNFADAIPLLTYPPSLLYQYGSLFNDQSMKEYSSFMLQFQSNKTAYFGRVLSDINEFFNFISTHEEIEKTKPAAPELDLVWLPDIQVVNTRSKKGHGGLFLAAKFGNNHESHNHNDVGSFVLFQNGHPVLIDIGVGTYTAKTFGAHRYELFYMQSQYHNCPTINGVQQKEGSTYAAHNVSMKELPNQEGVLFSGDIAGAYPKESQVKRWTRSIAFNQTSNSVRVDDQFELAQFLAPQQLHFVTVQNMTVEKTGQGLLLSHSHGKVAMNFDWQLFSLGEEVKSLDGDHHLTQVWGDSVKRITLTTNASHKELKGHFTVDFVEQK